MNNWEQLFDTALQCLDSVSGISLTTSDWSFGGGTALMLEFWHRQSKDIDIFLNDVQLLTFLSPRLNDTVEVIASDYIEMSNFVKLTLPEGEIDFIAAPFLTASPFHERVVRDHLIRAETPVEIVAKKVFYRASEFQPRDVLDLAVVLTNCHSEVWRNHKIFAAKLPLLEKRLQVWRGPLWGKAMAKLDILPAGEAVRDRAWDLVDDFLADLKQQTAT